MSGELLLGRDYPGTYSLIFRIKLSEDTSTGLAEAAVTEVFDPDGSVRRRVRAVLPSGDGQ
jgi:hypothetical protein